MEQKKLILVAISVGVFLLIAIGAAILVFGSGNSSPAVARTNPNGSPVIISPGTGISNIPASEVIITGERPQLTAGTIPVPEAPAVVTAAEPSVPQNAQSVPAANAEPTAAASPQAVPASTEVTGASGDSSTVISVVRPSTAAVPDVAPVNRQAPSAQTSAGSSASNTAASASSGSSSSGNNSATTTAAAASSGRTATSTAPASTASSSSSSARTTNTAPAATTTNVSRTPARTYNDFWVQTGSFSAIARAEGMKETLASKGIASIIENRVLEGTTWYRVRVGPYTSKSEADYWLSLIKSITGFEGSQVWQN